MSSQFQLKSGFMRHVHRLNHWNPDHFHAFLIAGQRVGYLKPAACRALVQWPEYFRISEQAVELRLEGGLDERSRVLDEVVHALVDQGLIDRYLGEPYPVCAGHNRDIQYACLDRGAAAWFGIHTFGQHLNGYVRKPDGLWLWVARRAADRVHFPGKLDNLVAGGLPQNLDLQSNLLKECREEAGLSARLASNAISAGAISYCCETEAGLKPDTLYCYDLELPTAFVPRNTDGEVAGFQLMPAQAVLKLIDTSDELKPNCNLVFLDFLIRHGQLPPEHPDYLELLRGLHA